MGGILLLHDMRERSLRRQRIIRDRKNPLDIYDNVGLIRTLPFLSVTLGFPRFGQRVLDWPVLPTNPVSFRSIDVGQLFQ